MKKTMCALVALAGCTTLASAQMYGSDSSGNYFLVDETNGNATIITNDDSTYNNGSGATEIEIHPGTGIGFAQNPNGFFTGNIFDAVTGASLNLSVVTNDAFQGLEYVGDTLYAAGWSGANATLYTLDPNSGLGTPIGDTGFGNPINGLAYDVNTNIMYASSGRTQELYTIDLSNGALNFIGNMGITVGSIEFGSNGLLYGGGGQNNASEIFTVDPATGESTVIGRTGLGTTVTGLTLLPAPSSLALLGLGGLVASRRRR